MARSPLLNNNQRVKKCKHCLNFIQYRKDESRYDCDYDYFNDVQYEDAVLYTPELFDCDKYEDLNDLS